MRKWFAACLALVVLLGLSSVSGATSQSTLNFDVAFAAETLPANAVATIEAMGGKVVHQVPEIGLMVVSGPSSLLKQLHSNPSIQAANPSLKMQLKPTKKEALSVADAQAGPSMDLYNIYQWDIKQMTDNGASWAVNSGSHNTVVGIIDSGVDPDHPALAANFLGGRNFVPADYYPGETGDPNNVEDTNGHGSHVAGSIAGKGRIMGIAPDLGFKAYRVFPAEGGVSSSIIIEAMIAAANDNVDVITMSLGGFDSISGYTWTDPATGEVFKYKDVASFIAYKRAVKYAVNKGIVVVAAAGNDAINISHPPTMTAFLNYEYGPYGYEFWGASKETPGALPGVLTVSATGPSTELASYSNYGQGVIDVTAPGGDFQRYPEPGWHLDMCLSAGDHGAYYFMAGTSMATPKVAATAALLIDQAKAKGEKLTPAQVVTKIQQNAVDIGKKGNDPLYGFGFVNTYKALTGK